MTTNTQEALDKAFEAGRVAERQMAEIAKMVEMSKINIAGRTGAILSFTNKVEAPPRKRGRAAKASVVVPTAAVKEPKATKVARGVKRASGPRTKGVKSAITSMIGDSPNGVTVSDIVELLKFKETSVRATLMGLKKAGDVHQNGKIWHIAALASTGGNSEAVQDSA